MYIEVLYTGHASVPALFMASILHVPLSSELSRQGGVMHLHKRASRLSFTRWPSRCAVHHVCVECMNTRSLKSDRRGTFAMHRV